MSSPLNPDDVCSDFSEAGLQIKVTEVDNVIVIEGTAEALMFLSELFAAQARSATDSFGISPFGAGRSWFSSGSTKGIYLHRIDK